MLSQETESRLARLIMAIANEEKKVELARQALAEQHHFEPFAAFQRIDRKCHGFISTNDIRVFLKY